jgi:hypothetical protein
MSSDGNVTAPQSIITINCNVDFLELQKRSENLASDGALLSYYQVFPTGQDDSDLHLNKGEIVLKRKGPPGEHNRVNVFTSLNGVCILRSKLSATSTTAGDRQTPLSDEERARNFLETQYELVGVCAKTVEVSPHSQFTKDTPVIALSGTYDMINMSNKPICAMDLIIARIPLPSERFKLPGGGGDVKGYSKTKWTAIPVKFNPTDVEPLLSTYKRYFGVDGVLVAQGLAPVKVKVANDVNDAAEAFAEQTRYMFFMGAMMHQAGAFGQNSNISIENLEKACGLAAYGQGEAEKFKTKTNAWNFLGDYKGMPISKAIMLLGLGLSKPLSISLVNQHKGLSHPTRNLSMNCGSNSISTQNMRVSILGKSIVGKALTSAAPGKSFSIEVRSLLQ